MGSGVWEYGAMRNRGMGHGEWSMGICTYMYCT